MSSLDGKTATAGDDAPKQSKNWPAWYYGPSDQAQIFNNADEIPQGWEDHPSKVKKSPAARQAAKDAQNDPYKDWTDEQLKAELDKNGVKYQDAWTGDKLRAVLRASVEPK